MGRLEVCGSMNHKQYAVTKQTTALSNSNKVDNELQVLDSLKKTLFIINRYSITQIFKCYALYIVHSVYNRFRMVNCI